MFKTLRNVLKTMGKKAIGYVRGLNGDKAATYLTAATTQYSPTLGAVTSPFFAELGKYVNSKVDNYLQYQNEKSKGGVVKPPKYHSGNIT